MTIEAIAFFRKYWASIGAALLVAALGVAVTVQTFRLQSTESALQTEKNGRQADRAEYKRAQAEATANALSDKMKKEAEYAAKADEADARYADLSGQYRAAVLRYQAAQRASRGTDLPRATDATQGFDSPGGGAVIPAGDILIPQADALICAENTARLQSARDWALSLER